MSVIQNIFTQEELSFFLNSSQVLAAKEKVDKLEKGSIYFTIPLTTGLRTLIQNVFNLDFSSLNSIPMRWIKGNTLPHVDKGISTFQNTYLAYVTESAGEFILGDESYPLTQGTGFIFNEGENHETKDTGSEPRLLLGPFSEQGFAVGAGTFIFGDGGQTAYIRDNSGTLEWSIDQSSWNTLYFPCGVQNNNTAAGIFKLEFLTNISVSNNNDYFYCYSENIQFGSESLQTSGFRPTITVTATNYDGLIENGSSGVNGFDNIRIYNLIVDGAGGTQQNGAGWFGKQYFGKGTTNNYIINCSSYGDINGGGILGDYSESTTIKGCSSYGEIVGATAGGIVGKQVTSITIDSCWSQGAISADGCGGMAGSNTISVTITKCYSTGAISGNNSGGILGSNGGITEATISNCYSTGAITGGNAGGICGSLGAVTDTFTISITNCYTTGNLNNTGTNYNGSICGLLIVAGSGAVNLTITNCYTTGTVVLSKGYIIANLTTINGTSSAPTQYVLSNNYSEAGSVGGAAGSWSSTHANSVLQNTPSSEPGVGSSWSSTGLSQPYEVSLFGATPYQIQTISGTSLIQNYSQSIVKGDSTITGIIPDASGNAFAILDITGGDIPSYTNITISSQTGAITTTSGTVSGTYTIYVRSTGSYYITTFTLTITDPVTPSGTDSGCCNMTLDLQDMDYTTRAEIVSGNMILSQFSQRRVALSYTDLIRIKQALAHKK